MLSKITRFLDSLNNDKESHDELTLELACTVLLCEVMRADGQLQQQERELLAHIISEEFSISEEEVVEIIEKGIILSDQAVDFYQFTSLINSHYSIEERMNMVKLLWKIAYADGELAAIEEHIIRKIADLLYLRQTEYVQTKPVKTQ